MRVASAVSRPSDPGQGASRAKPPTGPVVLLVDDDPDQLVLLKDALSRAGLDSIGVASAEAAIAALAAQRIGCVVADLRMPGMNGIDFVRTLRSRPETSTVPVILMTGFVDGDGVLEALDAGADDFLVKTVGLDEVIARVHAHLRTLAAWTDVVVGELQTRAAAIQAISQLALSSVPEEAAESIVAELAGRIGCEFVGVYRLVGENRLDALATWSAVDGMQVGGPELTASRGRHLVRRAREGPWTEALVLPWPGELSEAVLDAQPDLAAGAPIFAGEELVGLFVIAVAADAPTTETAMLRARLLASATDYASVLGAVAGPSIADRRQGAKDKVDLRRVLADGRFFPVFQPIVSLPSLAVVGYEALTRFADGTPPEIRFDRAAAAGLGFEFELAAIEAAVKAAPAMDSRAFLSFNVSPGLVVTEGKRLRRILSQWRGNIVIEVTEHAPIGNYDAFRSAVARFRGVELAIDDAGAGYASLRHILELGPAWVKLDITLVRGIDADPRRQDLVAGLVHFGSRSGQRLIAEGIERQEEADTLLGIGVEYAQGHLFGRAQRGRR